MMLRLIVLPEDETLLDVGDLVIDEGHFHVGVVIDLLGAKLDDLCGRAEVREHLILGLFESNGFGSGWRSVGWRRRRSDWGHGCGRSGRLGGSRSWRGLLFIAALGAFIVRGRGIVWLNLEDFADSAVG